MGRRTMTLAEEGALRGDVSLKYGGTEPISVDAKPGRFNDPWVQGFDGRRQRFMLQSDRSGIVSACSATANPKSWQESR